MYPEGRERRKERGKARCWFKSGVQRRRTGGTLIVLFCSLFLCVLFLFFVTTEVAAVVIFAVGEGEGLFVEPS